MSTLCVQCSMKALVEGKEPAVFNEEPDEHMRRVHPDPVVTQQERKELERKLYEKG